MSVTFFTFIASYRSYLGYSSGVYLLVSFTETTDFIVLDLFSGAGGFSYGIEKNKHFKTAIALDFNEQALQTFKYNMPDTEIVH